MKKLFVGILSLFLLFGAGFLTACGSKGTTLTLSKEIVEIQIHAGDEEGYEIVTAEVQGTDKASISANAKSSYESIVKVTTSKISDTKVSIKIEGLTEGNAEITVKSGSRTKYIHATVYSEVSQMSQKTEDGIKTNYLVRGQDNLLEEEKLIEFTPSSKSRRTITWSLTEPQAGLSLINNSLSIGNEFIGDNISLLATTEKDVQTTITLPVLDKIENEINLSYSYSKSTAFEQITNENNSVSIVPNVSTDEKYQAYLMLNYVGDLDISGYVLNSQGQPTDDIIVNRDGSLNDKPVFVVYANKEKTNINQDYTIYFKIGYKNYDYALSTLDILPITIQARELVNGVILSTYGSGNIENSTQTLYTEYADSEYSSVYGQQFNIAMIPSTVIGATNKYSISLSRIELGEPITKNESDCPIEIWYRDVINGNVWTFLPLEYDSTTGSFVTNAHVLPNASSLFLKASGENLIVQSAEGLKLTFTSEDNKNISSSFNLKLVRSVSQGDFTFPNGNFKVDSSVENVTLKKQFTLKGQTSIEGLDIITDSKAVTFDEIHYISNDEESVTFEIALTLKKSSYGVTTLDTYNIVHKNGLVSETMYIDIFLPLKEAGMFVDTVNNVSNSIIDSEFNRNTFDLAGNLLQNTNESLSTLMLKNNTTTPLIYLYNQINSVSAVANISVDYFDYDSANGDLASFISLTQSQQGIANILALAKDNKNSRVATFNGDYSAILTTGVGHTYAVIYFTGKGTDNVDEDGNITYVRILRIESLVTPEGMNVTPDSDKQVGLYSIESLATSDEDLTRHNVSIRFVKTNVTYKNVTNLTFISRNEVMGAMSRSQDGNTISWEYGRYTVSNISLTNEGITFTIAALHTFGEYIFTDTLDIHYVIYNAEDEKVYDISSAIKITINNAQRIESLIWENYDKDGLYFEVGNNSPQYMLFKTTPTNSKNKSVAYVLTDNEGVAQSDQDGNQTFVSVSNTVSSNILSINLNFTEGKTGYIYVLPADAIYNNQIKYYYKDGTTEREGYVAPSELGRVIDNDGTTNYDYLIRNAYFKSAVLGGEVKNVEFKDILLKVKVTVADGKSFEHSYRIYDTDTFNSIGTKNNILSSYTADRYYTVMTSLDVGSSRIAISNFTGGLQGYNSDVTIKLNGANFANTLGTTAEIRNIKFNGDVTAEGFLANENKGTITNVTIDVNGISASTLSVIGNVYGGGIVGKNSGTIDGAKILGLSISGKDATIGGIAGRNSGTIKNSAVEFYNLLTGQDADGKNTYGSNKFTGYIVGAIVGEIASKSTISYTYAYDYTLSSGSDSVIVGSNTSGAFAGTHNLKAGESATIDYAFSVVGQTNPYNGYSTDDQPAKMTNYYYGYFDGQTYTVRPESITSNPNFVQENDDNFDSSVNNGFPYLKNLQQSEKITSVAYDVKTVEENGYYKSVEVDSTNAILFYYALKDNFTELTSAQLNDLAVLNTITLSQLVGQDVSENVIITSSDFSKAKVVGSSIIIRKTGDVELMLSSKQNVTLNKTIKVKIVSPLSKVQISWTDLAENVNYVEDNAQLSLQKTRSRDFTISFYRPNVYLGPLATSFDIAENNYSLNILSSVEEGTKEVEYQIISNKQFKLLSNDDSSLTSFTLSPVLFGDKLYQNSIDEEFARTFKILPTEGVINFAISGETLPITPSMNASVKAEIQTTAESDSIVPVLSIDGVNLVRQSEGNVHKYTILGETDPIIEAVVSNITDNATKEANKNSKVKTYIFDINFAVAEESRANIANEYDFDVILVSDSGNSSEEWGGKFSIHIAEQEFTNIDVSNTKIKSATYLKNGDKYVEVYTVDKTTPVLAPGNSSILQVSVNPEYAYYDYVEFTYSGATVSNAVNVVVVEPYDKTNTQFTKKAIDKNNIETIGSRLVYRPSINDDKTTIYYKLWINTTVNRDTILKFTATFYRNGAKIVDYVNYYLTISYLTEPQITVDGANVTYLAKGSSADVKIDVLLDQKVDSLIVEGNGIEGISVSQLSEGTPDPERGIRTYTAKIYATVLAKTADKNTFYLKARVSRELNGSKEIKDSIATVVIVDFKIPTNGISISNTKDNNLTIWQGVSRALMVDYDILPSTYLYPSTEEMANAIESLTKARESFEKNEYYPVDDKNSDGIINEKDASYFINYIYDNKEYKYVKQSLYDRLFVVVNNTAVHVSDKSIDLPFEVIHDNSKVSIRGSRISGSINMLLKTYITSGYTTQIIETPFTITVEAYSDPDLPIKIANSTEFNNLNPANYDTSVAQVKNDYILENDIILENYTPFNTDLISSFDGNGHTIYIKSFNLNNTQSSTLNLALFNNVKSHTTLKNVRVNLYNGGQLTINVSKFKTINIAGLAIENAGVITNSEVVSFYSSDRAVGEIISDAACVKHNKPQGININYVDANGTDNVYLPDNANWSSQVAGFVINNSGSITNSRVGGEEIIIVGAERQINGESSGYTYASTIKLDTFHIVGQGNIAGFVLTNSGYVTSSFVKNIDIENQSNSISFFTSGFAGTNNNSILTSYIEGTPNVTEDMSEEEKKEMKKLGYTQYAFEGTSIRSKLGYVVGFIYENEGSIKDSYSNILIANSVDTTRVYYASGFVYMNAGSVENCYSASQIANSKYSQMNFSGVNESGELLKSGEYINCYFFNKEYEDSEDPNDYTTESQYGTGAQLITIPKETSAYYGFAIADGENDGIWRADEQRGVALIEANKTTISNRYTYYIDDNFEGISAEDSSGRKYILPYSVLTFVDSSLEIDTSLGGDSNPILVYDAQDFIEISGTSQSTYVQQYFNDNVMWGSYRLVNNINLLDAANSEETVALPSSSKAFAGRLYGNGFTVSGISISADGKGVAFGLFKSIESRKNSTPIITNLDLVISQVIAGDVVMVGGLAGYIKNATIINLDLSFEEENSMVAGLNFVGGLAGLSSGNNIIKNINITNPTVSAERRAGEDENDVYFKTSAQLQEFRVKLQNSLNFNTPISSPLVKDTMSKYSYAGSLIGFVDNFAVDNKDFNINQSTNYSINNIRVSGIVNVQGQVAGGIIGLTGYQTNVNDMGLIIEMSENNTSKILATKYFAGGAIGQSFGAVNRTFASYDKTTQDAIEDSLSAFYNGNNDVERGQLDIFSSPDNTSEYTQKYIGGLIGYVGSGKLSVSYSKLNVTAMSADYAGGVIGGMEVMPALSYKTDSGNEDDDSDTYTKYFINEVYASGDVRAKNYAGGIIGVINGKGSRVALLAVNSVNFFTNYDYSTKTYQALSPTVENMSITIKANSIIGHMIDNEGNVDESVDEKTYTSYVQFIKAGESYQSTGTTTGVREIPSVGYYEGYYTNNNTLVTLNIFGNVDGRIDDNNVFYKNEIVFAIAKPASYVDSAVGHTYTQAGFINSGAWANENWTHPSQDLFPSIRYKRTYDVLFLDQYNIDDVFSQMNGKNVHVIVRGRKTPETEECGDIDLAEYFDDYGNENKIKSYSGILEGGGGKVGDRDVKIITDRTFIESTAPGFSLNNLTIDYVANETDGAIEIKNGLLSQSSITEGAISNLTINLNAPAKTNLSDITDYNIGLLAPQLISSSLSDIVINSTTAEAILQVEADAYVNVTELNVGLLAGKATQSSSISTMIIQDVALDLGSIISIRNVTGAVNAGTYFGSLIRNGNQPLKITLESVAGREDISGTSNPSITVNAGAGSDLNLGGYVGYSQGIDTYNYSDENDNKTFVDFYLNSSTNLDVVYAGGVVGKVDMTNINGADESAGSQVETNMFMPTSSIKTLIAGGVVGGQADASTSGHSTTTGALTIGGFNTVDLSIVSGSKLEDANKLDKESLSGSYGGQIVTIGENAKVGGIAGYAVGEFTYTASSATTQINSGKESIRLSGNNLKIASVLGEASSSATILGSIISSAEYLVSSEGTAIVGGMLGNSVTGNVTINGGTASGNKITYLGAVYSNAENLVFGGMLGDFATTHKTTEDNLINIKDTIFGGVVKIYGTNSNGANVTTGGTVGNIALTAKALVENNYNYGDVFVEYGSGVNSLNTYNFGGIIGSTTELNFTDSNYVIQNNFSLVTSRNIKYSTANETTAHALFGAGNPWGDSTNVPTTNYYSHAVCLLVDELGSDADYSSDSINEEADGYGQYDKAQAALTGKIKGVLNSNVSSVITSGHKLSPTSDLENSNTFNGIVYYVGDINKQLVLPKLNKDTVDETTLSVAVIGNTRNQQTFQYSGKSIVDTLSGYSSISGIALNVKSNFDVSEAGDYAPLVKTMTENAIIYAVNVAGSVDIGGGSVINASGIVGDFQGGKIFDCSTDADINYRAAVEGSAYGLAKANGEGYKIIENSYTGGSISTMVKANVYAFTNGASTNVNNCYTYTKLDPRDYLNATTQIGTIAAFGSAKISNCYYDIDGLNYALSSEESGSSRRSSISAINTSFDDAKMTWVKENDFNFGYPTLKYQYLKNSSYVEKLEESAQGESGYDSYVITNTYERYAPGKSPENSDDYYYVPNGAVLFDNNLNTSKNYVLRYDIDFTKTASNDVLSDSKSKQIGAVTEQTAATNYAKTFDGNGKTIKGLTKTLFTNIEGGTIRNLRLTEVKIEDAPALANEIISGTISNMTFSGNITDASGAIANTFSGGEINTTTNMIVLTTENNIEAVGGLVGIMNGGLMLYSSNYGPVRTYGKLIKNLGGLVGLVQSGSISYSFNATSVLGNYAASSEALATTTGEFRTGGLVGTLENGSITHSYNSGMVKSGNKSNSIDADGNGGSYAGGIVGYAKAGIITNCYNEGTVEALGIDPTWKIVSQTNDGETTGFGLVVTGPARNVWAYGIGFINYKTNNTNFKNNIVRLENQDEYKNYEKTIKQNGMYYDNRFYNYDDNGDKDNDSILLKTWELKDIYHYDNIGYNNEGDLMVASYYKEQNPRNGWGDDNDVYVYNYIKDLQTTYKLKPLNNDNVLITSLNENGLPNRMIFEITKRISILNHVWYDDNYGSHTEHEFDITNYNEFTDFGVVDFSIGDYERCSGLNNETFVEGIYGKEDMISNITVGGRSGQYHTYTEQAYAKLCTRSQQSKDELSEISDVTIAGQNYYIADSNNYNKVFEAGTYSAYVSLLFEGVPYINDYSYYTLTASATDVVVGIQNIIETTTSSGAQALNVVAKLFKDGGKNEANNGFEDSYDFTLTFNYEKEISVNLSNMAYSLVANDDYAIGIDIDEVYDDAYPMTDYALQSMSGIMYENVVKLSSIKFNTEIIEPKSFSDSRYIYVALDTTNQRLIYVPNATLNKINKDADGNKLYSYTAQVNNLTLSYDENGDYNKKESYNAMINLFANKTLYYKSTSVDTKYIDIFDKISSAADVTGNFIAGETTDNLAGNYKYGKTYSVTTNSFNILYNEEQSAYTLEFANELLADDLLVLNGTTPIISYNKNAVILGLGSTSTFTIGGEEYTFAVSGNQIVIDNDLITEENIDVINSIKDFFSKLTYITNQIPAQETFTIFDKFNYLPNIIIKNENNVGITIERSILKQWYVDNIEWNDTTFTTNKYSLVNNNDSVTVKLNKENLNSYTLNGVTVYQDEIDINLKESYSSQLGNTTIYSPNAKSYVEITLTGSTTETYNSITESKQHTPNGNIFDSDVLTGSYNAKISFFSTYEEKSYSQDETSEYKLVFTDSTGEKNYYTEVKYENSMFIYDSVTQIFDTYAIKLSVEEVEGGYVEYRFKDYNSKDDEILVLREYNNNAVYKVDNGVESNEQFEFSKNITLNNIEYNIDDIEALFNTSFDDLLKCYVEGNNSYIYLANKNFKFKDSVSWKDDSFKLSTQVNSKVYDWNEFAGPNYIVESRALDLETCQIDTENNTYYEKNGNILTIILKGNSDEEIFTIKHETIKQDNNINKNKDGENLSAILKSDKCPIILVKDISFNDSNISQLNANIIGNDYYISYYNNSFFDKINLQVQENETNNKFVKEVSLLGETYNKSLFNNSSTGSASLEFNNVNFYGSVINFAKENVVLDCSNATLRNISSYLSVNGARRHDDTLAIFGNSVVGVGVENWGAIIGANGYKGANGINDKIDKNYGVDSNDKGDGIVGDNGQSIKSTNNTEENIEITNNGIIKTGEGGNGGAGGNHVVRESTDEEPTVLEAYAGGNAGAGGVCSGTNVSITGNAGTAGKEGAYRSALFTMEMGYKAEAKCTGKIEIVTKGNDFENWSTLADELDNISLLINGEKRNDVGLTKGEGHYGTAYYLDKMSAQLADISTQENAFGVITRAGLQEILSVYTLGNKTNTVQFPASILNPNVS